MNKRTYSRYTIAAVKLLGKQIQLARKQQRWAESDLAQRAGIARATLQRIEKGDMACSVGLVFEVATVVGINLFDADSRSIKNQIAETGERIALLPKHVYPIKKDVDDDF